MPCFAKGDLHRYLMSHSNTASTANKSRENNPGENNPRETQLFCGEKTTQKPYLAAGFPSFLAALASRQEAVVHLPSHHHPCLRCFHRRLCCGVRAPRGW